ncbi:MAG: lasso peptide biosynthesis B2 protein [Desulfosporosinus sp.]|nr:lasso peptide biosynthesis B2 protein [Desulfosporosinus sp.]
MSLRLIRNFIKQTNESKTLHLEASICLFLAKLLVVSLPFKKLAPKLGIHGKESIDNLSDEDYRTVKQLSKAITAVSRNVPWSSKCLDCAFAAKLMLRRRKISNTLYLGVAKDEQGKMIAHAWVRTGEFYITGGEGSKKYAETGKFSD